MTNAHPVQTAFCLCRRGLLSENAPAEWAARNLSISEGDKDESDPSSECFLARVGENGVELLSTIFVVGRW